MPSLLEDVQTAIGTVIDPCSRFNGVPLSLTELGMVKSVKTSGSTVQIRLLLDDPTCLYTFEIQHELRKALSAVAGVESIELELVADELWTPDRVQPQARALLDERRAARRQEVQRPIQIQPLAPTRMEAHG